MINQFKAGLRCCSFFNVWLGKLLRLNICTTFQDSTIMVTLCRKSTKITSWLYENFDMTFLADESWIVLMAVNGDASILYCTFCFLRHGDWSKKVIGVCIALIDILQFLHVHFNIYFSMRYHIAYLLKIMNFFNILLCGRSICMLSTFN